MAEQNKNIKIIVDRSEELKQAQATIDQLNQRIGSQQELLKKYLAEDAQRVRIETERKAIEAKMDKKPPEDGETAMLEDEHTLRNLDFENSEFLDMMRFTSVEKGIQTTLDLARKGSPDAKRAMVALTRKVLKKPISLEFTGSVKQLATQTETPIPELCDSSTRKQLEARNAKIRANRLAWKVI